LYNVYNNNSVTQDISNTRQAYCKKGYLFSRDIPAGDGEIYNLFYSVFQRDFLYNGIYNPSWEKGRRRRKRGRKARWQQ
jgi:hypothetical protein